MPGAFQGISIAGSALRAFQSAMQVTSNNLANVNTRGYTRQTVEFRQTEPTTLWSYGEHKIGTGTAIGAIARAKDMFQESRIRTALGNQGRSETLRDSMNQIEGIYNEPGSNGLSSAMDALFNSFSGLASNPNDAAGRWNVRQNAITLTERVRNNYKQLEELENGANVAIQDTIASINSITETIAQMNVQIRETQVNGGQASAMMDERDLLVRELGGMVQINTTQHQDGTVSIYSGTLPLVLQAEARAMPSTYNPANFTVTNGTDTYTIRGGQVQGQMETIQRIKSAKADLDKLANEFKTAFNSIHTTGINQQGNTNVNFFADVISGPQAGAKDFNISAEVAADPKAIATSITGLAGDGGLALSMSQLKSASRTNLGGSSLTQFYRDHITGISNEVDSYTSAASINSDIVSQIDQQIQSVSGVSIDEEMVDLTRFQRSYQAAAKVLSIMDQTAEDLINLIR